jgi:hypothetical protein
MGRFKCVTRTLDRFRESTEQPRTANREALTALRAIVAHRKDVIDASKEGAI